MSFGHQYARVFAGIDDHLEPSDHDPLVHERIMPMSSRGRGSLGDTPSASGSAPDMLQRFGISAGLATLGVVTLMSQTVGNANPAAAGTQVVVKGAQNALNEIAAGAGSKERLQVDGILGAQTLKALAYQWGGNPVNVPWLTIYGVLRNRIDTKQFSWTPLKDVKPNPMTPVDHNQVELVDDGGFFNTQNMLIVGGGALLAALVFGGSKSKGGKSRRKGRR